MRIGVCTPLRRQVSSDFMISLIYKLNELGGLGHSVSFYSNDKIPVSWARTELIDTCVKARCDKAIFIDSDVAVPKGVLPELLKSEHTVASALYYSTSYPHSPVVRNLTPDKGYEIPAIDTTKDKIMVDAVGMGCCVVDLSIIPKLPRPFFFDTWFLTDRLQEGEDIFFCRLVREAGGSVALYPKLLCMHIGAGVPYDMHGYQY